MLEPAERLAPAEVEFAKPRRIDRKKGLFWSVSGFRGLLCGFAKIPISEVVIAIPVGTNGHGDLRDPPWPTLRKEE